MTTSIRGFVSGRVQGVGFRYFVREQAAAIGVAGYVRNLPDGRVEFLFQGEPGRVEAMLDRVRQGPAHSRVDDVSTEAAANAPAETGFSIR